MYMRISFRIRISGFLVPALVEGFGCLLAPVAYQVMQYNCEDVRTCEDDADGMSFQTQQAISHPFPVSAYSAKFILRKLCFRGCNFDEMAPRPFDSISTLRCNSSSIIPP